MGSDAGMAADFINSFIHFLGYWLYEPVFHIYDILPFHESLSQWRLEFTNGYFNAYLKPMFIGFCFNLAVEAVFGPGFGSILNLFGDLIAIAHFFDNIGVGLVHVTKGVLGFPVYIICSLAPYVLPPIITIVLVLTTIKGIRNCFRAKVQ